MRSLPLGKLDSGMLEMLLQKHFRIADPRLIMGPKIGEDAAIIDFGDTCLVAKTDPITFATEEIGWYAVNVNANDLAVRGAKPTWFQATILLPEGKTTRALVERTFSQISSACRDLDICVIGGHTEITYDLHRPIVVGCMLGEVKRDRLVTTSGARIGDAVVITKGIVVEGTSVIAWEKGKELKNRGYPPGLIKRARDYIRNPGISVVREALLATQVASIHCMHDPTEGGLANGLYEIAYASGVGMVIDAEAVPVLPEAALLCDEFGLDPMGTLTSGTLIITLPVQEAPHLVGAFQGQGMKASIIGEVVEKGLFARVGGKKRKLRHCEKDEITRLFEETG